MDKKNVLIGIVVAFMLVSIMMPVVDAKKPTKKPSEPWIDWTYVQYATRTDSWVGTHADPMTCLTANGTNDHETYHVSGQTVPTNATDIRVELYHEAQNKDERLHVLIAQVDAPEGNWTVLWSDYLDGGKNGKTFYVTLPLSCGGKFIEIRFLDDGTWDVDGYAYAKHGIVQVKI